MPYDVNENDRRILDGVVYAPETDTKGKLTPARMLQKGDVYCHPTEGLVRIEMPRTPGSDLYNTAAIPANFQHVWVPVPNKGKKAKPEPSTSAA